MRVLYTSPRRVSFKYALIKSLQYPASLFAYLATIVLVVGLEIKVVPSASCGNCSFKRFRKYPEPKSVFPTFCPYIPSLAPKVTGTKGCGSNSSSDVTVELKVCFDSSTMRDISPTAPNNSTTALTSKPEPKKAVNMSVEVYVVHGTALILLFADLESNLPS